MPFWAAAAAVGGSLLSSNASGKASDASKSGQSAALRASEQAGERARAAAIPLFDASQRNALAGFQGALDIQGQFAPEQMRVFQEGNMQAQNTMRGGLDPQIAAILGGNVDLSGLQAQQVQTPDASMFQQQLPEFSQMIDVLPTQAAQYIPGALEELQQRAIDNPGVVNRDPNSPYFGMDELLRNTQANYQQNYQPTTFDDNWNGVPAINTISGSRTGAYSTPGNPPPVGWGGPRFLGGG
jgi:hypothetical protein